MTRSSKSRTRPAKGSKEAATIQDMPTQISDVTPELIEAVKAGGACDVIVKSGVVRRVTMRNGEFAAYYETPPKSGKWHRINGGMTDELLKAFDPDAYVKRSTARKQERARDAAARAEYIKAYEEEMRQRRYPYLYGTKGDPADINDITPDTVRGMKVNDYQDVTLKNGDVRRVVKVPAAKQGYWDLKAYEKDSNGKWQPSYLTGELSEAFPSEDDLMLQRVREDDRAEQQRFESLPKEEQQKEIARLKDERHNIATIANSAARTVSGNYEFRYAARDVYYAVDNLLSACRVEKADDGQADAYTKTLSGQYIYFAAYDAIQESEYGMSACAEAASDACDGYKIRLNDDTRSRIIKKEIASSILQNSFRPEDEFAKLENAGIHITKDDAYFD